MLLRSKGSGERRRLDGGFEPAQPSGEQDRTADSRMDPERIDYLGTVERYTEGLLKRLAPRA